MIAQQTALEIRVMSRKLELISEINEHKKNSCRAGAGEAVERIKARLSDLAFIMNYGVVDGWANVGRQTEIRLDEWIAR